MKIASEASAKETLKKLFSKSETRTISLEEAYSGWGRSLNMPKENRNWITNKLILLNHYRYIIRKYSVVNHKRKLTHIGLTNTGLAVITGRSENKHQQTLQLSSEEIKKKKLTLGEVLEAIPYLQEEYKDTFNIKISITPREG